MNEIDERVTQIAEDKNDRRNFLKRIFKYAIGLSVFWVASLFGLKRNGEIRLAGMKGTGFGLSEAHGICGAGLGCAGGGWPGGGGQCGAGMGCAGGGGQCGAGMGCAGQ